jgi:hypothetical protein
MILLLQGLLNGTGKTQTIKPRFITFVDFLE